MGRLISDFQLDRISFWFGFIAATILWLLLRYLRPRIINAFHALRSKFQEARQGATINTEVRIRNGIIRYAQQMHIAAPLFSLEEILVEPRLLAPPPIIEPGSTPHNTDITELVLPYMPDWPELAALYSAPTITLTDILQSDANFTITGHPGSGKTVALAFIAIKVARKEFPVKNLQNPVPIYIHASEICIPLNESQDILQPFIEFLTVHTENVKDEQLVNFVKYAFESNRILLLIDGMDELPPSRYEQIADYLFQILETFPGIRVIVTSSLGYYDGMTAHGFIPLAMATWDDQKRAKFINRWSNLWTKYIGLQMEDSEVIDPLLLNAWLLRDHHNLSPLDETLRIWAIYSGDSLGPKPIHSLEAAVRRSIDDIGNERNALERLATIAILIHKPFFSIEEAENYISNKARELLEIVDNLDTSNEAFKNITNSIHINVPQLLSGLKENGLIISSSNDIYRFSHISILGYLASLNINLDLAETILSAHGNWIAATETIGYFSVKSSASTLISSYANQSQSPLYKELLTISRWLRNTPTDVSWGPTIMRELVQILNDESNVYALRTRALGALATSGAKGIEILFRRMLDSNSELSSTLGILGLGQLRDTKSVDEIASQLSHSSHNIRRAACLSLVAIGSSNALEAVAEALLTGDDELRKTAAESLANNFEEGHPTLREGATLDDLLVRRAVVYGLQRVKRSWAVELLNKMQVDDEQWVVKNAATHVLDELSKTDPRIPQRFPQLTETPWLISFAGQRGIGVAPGRPAVDLVVLAMQEGNEEERIAALQYLSLNGETSAIPIIYQIMLNNQETLGDDAYLAVWHLLNTSNNNIRLN